jgi:hypothetical protein
MIGYGRRRGFPILRGEVDDVNLQETGDQHETRWATYP